METTATDFLRRVFAKSLPDMPPEAAQWLAEIEVDEADQERAQELGDKNQEGTITAAGVRRSSRRTCRRNPFSLVA